MNFLMFLAIALLCGLLQTLQYMSEEVEGEGVRREEGEKRERERREGDSQEGERQHEGPEGADELDELTRALQGFEPETGQSNKPSAEPQYVPFSEFACPLSICRPCCLPCW